MMRQTELVERVASYIPDVDEDLLNRAYVYAMHQHRHQKRASGDPYFSHPLEVASIVTDLKLDQSSVVAALLHDTIEDTDSTRSEIDSMFGHEIGVLVDGLTKLKRIDLVSKKSRQGENLRKLLLAIADDVRVLLVKLADRLHNMRTLNHVKPEKRQRIAQETMDIYAPLAGRMGMQDVRDELEELAFQVLHPEAYSLVHEKLAELSEESRTIIMEVEQNIVDSLSEGGIEAQVSSRSKRPYSIFRKMERNNIGFEQLSDVIGFRVIVEKTPHCYQALGAVHMRWRAVPGRFKDYISTPKQNDYRSIHTTVVGPSRQRVELQIRTHEMHEIAEYGIAAHALYKDGVYAAEPGAMAEADESRSYAWLRRTVESLSEGDHPDDILEHTRLELFHDQVFCFTPKGRLIALPQGATAIDFAYAVHTDVGNSCIGCRINGKRAAAVSHLRNGDEVQIIRGKNFVPPLAWENVVATGKARAGIRRAARQARLNQYRSFGEKMLGAAFDRIGKPYDAESISAVLDRLAHETVDDVLSAVGQGEMPPEDVVRAVYPDYQKERLTPNSPAGSEGWFNLSGVANLMFRIPGVRKDRKRTQAAIDLAKALPITGVEGDLPVSFDPDGGAVPGDRIVGIVTPDKGIVVYPIQASGLQKHEEESERWIDLRWDIHSENSQRFPAKIKLTAVNTPGVLATIAERIAKSDANIASLYVTTPEAALTNMVFGVEVWNLKHLNHLIRDLQALPTVERAERDHG